ncbi:MAG: hypothetical protein ACXWQ5_01055 [Ktedonobacterales bacterium]
MIKLASNTTPAQDRVIDHMVATVVERATHTAVIDSATGGPLKIEGAYTEVLRRFKTYAPYFNAAYGWRIDDWNYIILVDTKRI